MRQQLDSDLWQLTYSAVKDEVSCTDRELKGSAPRLESHVHSTGLEMLPGF